MGDRFRAGLETLRSLPVVGNVRGLGMMCAVELVEDQATRKPAIGLGGRVVAEAMKRGLIIRQRGGGGTPVSGRFADDRAAVDGAPKPRWIALSSIIGESIQAAT